MIDCSHGNSQKQFARQVAVAEDIATQLSSGETGQNIMGVMIESHLKEGRQNVPAEGHSGLVYGQSTNSLDHSCHKMFISPPPVNKKLIDWNTLFFSRLQQVSLMLVSVSKPLSRS